MKLMRFLAGISVLLVVANCSENQASVTLNDGRNTSRAGQETNFSELAKVDTTLQFQAADGLPVTADVRIAHDRSAPFLVLFHQAGWSRGEYKEIVPKLVSLGFNCMAIDQRSGDAVNGVRNQTHKLAAAAGKPTSYLDAYQDLEATVRYVEVSYAPATLIVWGSSYSAALVIKLASEHDEVVDGVLSFSPGEYFGRLGVGGDYITKAAKKLNCPVFVTSARSEKSNWFSFYRQMPSATKQFFLPKTAGNHGSRALWSKFSDSGAYWQAVRAFLTRNFLEVRGR